MKLIDISRPVSCMNSDRVQIRHKDTYPAGARAIRTNKSWDGSMVKSIIMISNMGWVHIFKSGDPFSNRAESADGSSKNEIEAVMRRSSSLPFP